MLVWVGCLPFISLPYKLISLLLSLHLFLQNSKVAQQIKVLALGTKPEELSLNLEWKKEWILGSCSLTQGVPLITRVNE